MDFKLQLPQNIVFGCKKFQELINYITPFGKRLVIVTGKSSFLESNHWVRLKKQLKDQSFEYVLVSIPGEPGPEIIDKSVAVLTGFDPEVIVAIGGGSVLDAGKAISAILTVNEPVENYLEGVGDGRLHPGSKIPFIAIPTTSGTGSEATKNAVISRVGEKGYKKSLRHNNFVPDFAILDPELTLNCPAGLTAWSGMDAFTQLLESYLSTASNPFTDAIALSGLHAIKAGLEQSVFKNSIEARENMSYAALCSGITLANAGLGTIHGFASSIGGRFIIPHGLICGALMGAANEITLNSLFKNDLSNKAIAKYAEVGKIFHESTDRDNVFYSEFLINKIYDLNQSFALPRLTEVGYNSIENEAIVSGTSNKNNPVALSKSQLVEILEKVG